MSASLVRYSFALIVIAAVALAIFRIMTAPDRIAERRNTARNVCVGGGGEWVTRGRDEYCRRAGTPKP